MTRREVTCINKSDRYNPHERILRIGGTNFDRSRWYATQQQAIAWIENRQFELFVRVGGREVNVVVAISRFGHKYIKTEADGEQPDNLLSLPECPQ
jgi:uncharacterized protein DUF3892